DDVAVANVLAHLASLYAAERKDVLAESVLRQALAIFRQQLTSTDGRIASALTNLACILAVSGRYAEAKSYLEEAWHILDRPSATADPRTIITALNLYGVLSSTSGFDDLAEYYLQRALAQAEGLYGPNHPIVAHVLQNFAGVMRHRHRKSVAK